MSTELKIHFSCFIKDLRKVELQNVAIIACVICSHFLVIANTAIRIQASVSNTLTLYFPATGISGILRGNKMNLSSGCLISDKSEPITGETHIFAQLTYHIVFVGRA